MNAVIRAVTRMSIAHGIEVLGIMHGYAGLIANDFKVLTARDVDGLLMKGGTMLYTARCEEMFDPEYRQRAADNCRFLGIDGLVCCGGDGTFRGAQELSRLGVPCVCVSGTIDNDISCTDYTIGFDTACNTAISAIDKLRDTMQSHARCSVVEVMGRHHGHLALAVGASVGAAAILVPEEPGNFEQDVIEKIHVWAASTAATTTSSSWPRVTTSPASRWLTRLWKRPAWTPGSPFWAMSSGAVPPPLRTG